MKLSTFRSIFIFIAILLVVIEINNPAWYFVIPLLFISNSAGYIYAYETYGPRPEKKENDK